MCRICFGLFEPKVSAESPIPLNKGTYFASYWGSLYHLRHNISHFRGIRLPRHGLRICILGYLGFGYRMPEKVGYAKKRIPSLRTFGIHEYSRSTPLGTACA